MLKSFKTVLYNPRYFSLSSQRFYPIMEENEGNIVRIRLVFDDHILHKSQRRQRLRRCWLVLERDITNIGEVASQIRECFGLRHRIVLLKDDFVLPFFESTCLITDKDTIRVKKKEAKHMDICKPCNGKNLLQDFENARVHDLCTKNSIHLESFDDVGSTKRKRKHSEKLLDSKGQYEEVNSDNEFEPRNNSDVRKKKQARPQMVLDSSDREEDAIACVVKPDYFHFQPREHGTQQADVTQVDGAPVSEGMLPLSKPEVLPSAIDTTKSCKHVIHFEIILPLRRLPMKGDILAYRYIESSSLVHPQLSSPHVGEVSSFDYRTLQIILLPVLDYVFVLDENPHGIIGQSNISPYKEDGSLEIEYLSLVDVRLVKAHDPKEEKAYQNNQARKDNWEEALLMGNWNEHNASTAEPSNNWAQWIPNNIAIGMSRSFKQPNAPITGRGTGRTNLASNRSMNNMIPNRNITNWNSYRNNAAWNPNRNNTRFSATDNTATLSCSYRASRLPNPWEHQQNNNF